jgi:hypothetical protein
LSELADELVDAPTDDADIQVDGGVDDPSVARADAPEAPPSAPSLDLDSWEAQQRIAQIADERVRATLAAFTPQPEPPTFELDPLSDDFGQRLAELQNQALDSRLAPVLDFVQAQQQQQTDNYIQSELSAAAEAAKLEGVEPGLLRSVAAHFAQQPEFARYGATAQGVRATAQKAAEWIATERKAAADAAVQNYRRQIGEIADAPAEPGTTGGGLQPWPRGLNSPPPTPTCCSR